jgi:hypothetical protein
MLLLKGLTRATNNYSIFFKVSLAKEKVTNIRHLVFFGVLDALVVSKSFNASAENEQRRVDVSGFLLTVASVQGLLDAFRTGQVTERQHRHPRQMRLFLETKKFNLIKKEIQNFIIFMCFLLVGEGRNSRPMLQH